MITTICITRAQTTDARALAEVAKASFALAGPADADPAQIQRYLSTQLNKRYFESIAASTEHYLACAREEGRILGFVQIKLVSEDQLDPGERSAELQKLYVLPEYHGKGVAQAMLEDSFAVAASSGARAICLAVFSGNERAKRFYAKFGFEVIGSTTFKMGEESHRDDLMRAKLL